MYRKNIGWTAWCFKHSTIFLFACISRNSSQSWVHPDQENQRLCISLGVWIDPPPELCILRNTISLKQMIQNLPKYAIIISDLFFSNLIFFGKPRQKKTLNFH